MMEHNEINDDCFEDVTPGKSMEDPEAPEEEEKEDEEEVRHDQLPSLEEAKANADLDGNNISKTKSRCRFCAYMCGCICCAFILTIVIAVIVGQASQKEYQASRHQSSNSEGPAPTLAPGTHESRTDYVKKYLAAFSDEGALNNPKSPQSKAAVWIADHDVAHLDLDDPAFIERYALATLYFSTNGHHWELNLGFLTEDPVCKWFHVGHGADNEIRQVGVDCRKGDTVQELFFPEKWMAGSLPSELELLKDLKYISIYRNPGLAGTFPAALRKLTNLEYLAMHFCDIEKQLPTWIGEMTSLTSLILSNNDITGTLPSSIGHLTNLKQLFLDDNGLQGNINVIHPLHKLEALMLEDNQLSGKISESMVKQWSNMQLLDLSHNNLTHTLPKNIWDMKNLSVLDFHGNKFEGPIPNITEPNHVLTFLALYETNLNATVPSTISNLKKLSHLDLITTLITGDIPEEIGALTDLKYLFLGMNAFNKGKIPIFLEKMTKLEDLSLKATNRVGGIPHWIMNMTNLILLDLDTNELKGTIPRVIDNLKKLKFILLNRNQLTGTIPESLKELPDLDFLLLERNDLNGSAHPVCSREVKPQIFMADCAEIACPCCTSCCKDDETDEQCDDQVWLGGIDPIWETKYERLFYKFEKVQIDG